MHVLDWLDDPDKALNTIKQAIDEAIEAHRSGTAEAGEEQTEKREITFEREEPINDKNAHVYTPYVPEVIGEQEYFYDASSNTQIKRIITDAVITEAPVSRDMLLHYVLASFDMKKTAKAETRFADVFDSMGLKTTERKECVFVWDNSQEPSDYSDFSGVSPDGEKRRIDDVATEEIGAAVVHILSSAISLERSELVKETVKLFGASRTTEAGELAVSMGISHAVRSGRAKVDTETGRIMLN